ncbi:nucleoside phosphorylase domain-containing protein [Aspergillus granulosus]|uniref:Nucleoside phosphorylase domain-containing protein n=1 Tax=Aspergillus granulosus TaxID=176169 RepID=A0ABR4I0H0_9EURO
MATSRTSESRPKKRNEFTIAVICALQIESDAIEAMFDERWEYVYGKAPADSNTYATGRFGRHNVVLVFLPSMGKASAASATASLLSSFPDIRLALVVGICGAVPTYTTDTMKEILLGDVIISTGIIQYDFGRRLPNTTVRKNGAEDYLSPPPKQLRSMLQKLGGLEGRRILQEDTLRYLKACKRKEFKCPGVKEDKLFKPTYRHKHYSVGACEVCARCLENKDETCEEALSLSCDKLGCSEDGIMARNRLATRSRTQELEIHLGLIASGDLVMKSGYHRDVIAKKEKVIAFEMEGAGVWDNLPAIIIKGVCDYADSHKNKKWQRYSALSAAACTKAFLKQWIAWDETSTPESSYSSNGNTGGISSIETYDYVRRSQFIAIVLLALEYACLSPLSPLSWRCVTFEDALGRKQKLPFELCRNLDAFNQFLLKDFKNRPGWHKVLRKEYVIASGKFGGAIITPDTWIDTIRPNCCLTMIIRLETRPDHYLNCLQKLSETEKQCSSCMFTRPKPGKGHPRGPIAVEQQANRRKGRWAHSMHSICSTTICINRCKFSRHKNKSCECSCRFKRCVEEGLHLC